MDGKFSLFSGSARGDEPVGADAAEAGVTLASLAAEFGNQIRQ
jgi:hypothetical protein